MEILLAEDDGNFGTILKRELEEDGHHVSLVRDGVEAVMSFIEHPADFLLFDIHMPRLNGIDTLIILRGLSAQVPAILISGQSGSLEIAENRITKAAGFLAKPFEMGHLKYMIAEFEHPTILNPAAKVTNLTAL
jgi:two-component system, OmpR family, response regulator